MVSAHFEALGHRRGEANRVTAEALLDAIADFLRKLVHQIALRSKCPQRDMFISVPTPALGRTRIFGYFAAAVSADRKRTRGVHYAG